MSTNELSNLLKDIPPAQMPTLRRVENAWRYCVCGNLYASNTEPPLSDELVLHRARDIAEAYRKRTILHTAQREEQEGVLKPVAGGCRFVYVKSGGISQVVYSFEDLVLTAHPPHDLEGLPYHFQALAEPITIRTLDALKAQESFFIRCVDQYHLWRAGIKLR